jgi:hypothetical protein
MDYWASRTCEEHPNPFDCPDHLIYFDATKRTYGLIVHDGGSSVIEIAHCPWCGKRISK